MTNMVDLAKQNKEIEAETARLRQLNQRLESEYASVLSVSVEDSEESDGTGISDTRAPKNEKNIKNLKDELKQKVDEATDQKEQEVMTEEFDAKLAEVMSDLIDVGRRE